MDSSIKIERKNFPERCPGCNSDAFDFSIVKENSLYCFPKGGGCGRSFSTLKCPKCGNLSFFKSKYNEGYYCDKKIGCGESERSEYTITNKKEENSSSFIKYVVHKNSYSREFKAYSLGIYNRNNEDWISHSSNILRIKNSFADNSEEDINKAKEYFIPKIQEAIEIIIKENFNLENVDILAVPRSKIDDYWKTNQLNMRPMLSEAIQHYLEERNPQISISDSVNSIKRVKNTKTTHKSHMKNQDVEDTDPEPYVGITRDTCELGKNIKDKNIILIDDIYTANKGIDEDMVEFLYKNGAKKVILLTLGLTA